jgi:tetratricopeptide (TPR) repeat protein
VIFALLLLFQGSPDPAALFTHGKVAEAERALRATLAQSPSDARSLMLLAVVLDSQKRFEEAEPVYRRATKAAPGAVQVWNNFGNHWLARGRITEARNAFEHALKLDSSHPNANLQAARIAVDTGRAAEALPCLERLRASESGDPALLALYGRALAAARDFRGAEAAFSAALDKAPAHFDLRLNLGIAALNGGNTARALDIFTAAQRQQPQNPDVLTGLARAYLEAGRLEASVGVLADLRRLAPERPEVQVLLARAATAAGFHEDAARAWEQYLKLRPGSPDAQRERAFSLVRAGDKGALAALEAFATQHPKDAIAQFELGAAYTTGDVGKALAQLDKAIALAPDFEDALYVRGALLAQDANFEKAAADLHRAVELNPRNARAVDQLGHVYRTLGRKEEAEQLLRRAVQLDPNSGSAAMHLALALRDNGKVEESRKYFERFRELGGEERSRAPSGLLDFLNLAPEQRREQYLSNLRRAQREQPGNQDVVLRLGLALLDRGEFHEAEQVLGGLTLGSRIEKAAQALLDSGRYAAVKEVLKPSGKPSVNLAIAEFHLAGPDAGIAVLEKLPESDRNGDYWLARAQMLDAAGRFDSAVDALNRGFAAAPTRSDLYHAAMEFLVRNKRLNEAANLMEQATKRLPDDPQVLLDRAVALELTGRFEEARNELAVIERRWPEWSRPWAVHGISFMTRGKAVEALPLLETAAALGEDSPELHYYTADALASLSPDNRGRALAEVSRTLAVTPENPYAHELAGRLEFEGGQHDRALRHLKRSIELMPESASAHYQLMRVYSAMGNKSEAKKHADISVRLRSESETQR